MGEPPVAAGSLAVGSSVFTNVNGVKTEFLVVHQGKPSSLYDDSCNGTWLLMKDCYENRQWHNGSSNKYEGSDIHTYLNSTFLNLFSSNIKDVIKQVKIPYRKNGGYGTNQSSANGLSCKIFLLSGYEVGWTSSDHQYFPQDGAKLSYFESGTGTSANNKRIAYRNGSATNWWLRSPDTDDSSFVWRVSSDGNYGRYDAATSYGVRPAFIIPSTALIDSEGNITGKTQSLTGTWVFNSTLTSMNWSGTALNGVIHYLCNGVEYNDISWDADAFIYGNSFEAYNRETDRWNNEAYRVITFTEPFERWYHAPFYDWFVSNAKEVKAENLYGYKFTSGTTIPVTVPASTLTGDATQQILDGTAPLFNVLCWHNADGNTSFANSDLCTKISSRVRYIKMQSANTFRRYAYSYVSMTSINGNKYNIASKGISSLTAPSSAIVVSDVDNLYFADEPTGDLLTWLNKYATKI